MKTDPLSLAPAHSQNGRQLLAKDSLEQITLEQISGHSSTENSAERSKT